MYDVAGQEEISVQASRRVVYAQIWRRRSDPRKLTGYGHGLEYVLAKRTAVTIPTLFRSPVDLGHLFRRSASNCVRSRPGAVAFPSNDTRQCE